MKQKSVFGLFFILLFFSLIDSTSAQYAVSAPTPTPTPSPSPTATPLPPCPTVRVQSRTRRQVRDGERINFAVQITAADPKIVPTIIWNVSAGYITSGQNTRQIEVDTTGAGTTPDRQVRAEVWIGGYAPQCVLQTSATINVIPPATKFAEFGLADEPTLRRDLEGVAAHFSQSRESLFLIGYAGQASKPGFSKEWLGRIRDALVAFGVSARRIATVDGGLREKPWFEVWSVPRGATPPRPTPTVDRPAGSDPPAGPSS